MLLKDISFINPIDNILYDEILFNLAELGKAGESLRFWESSQYFVVLGRASKEDEDVNLTSAFRDDIQVIRRSSGGGTVLQGPGCLNYSLILSKDNNTELTKINGSYQYILSKIIKVLANLQVKACFKPISDIALAGSLKKISGNAQRRGRHFILHHGTILYNFKIDLVEKYLALPKKMPEYRQSRSHRDFITNAQVSKDDLKREIIKMFKVEAVEGNINKIEADNLSRLKQMQEVLI